MTVALISPIVSIHQPAYLPWLGYLDRIRRSDLFIFLDTVPFQKNSFQNRNKVRTAQGWTWLTVPVVSRGHTTGRLDTIHIDGRHEWQRKHWATIRQSYARAPYAERLFSWLARFYETNWTHLAELCWDMLAAHAAALGIKTELRRARDLPEPGSHKSKLVLDLCLQAGARTYLSGPLGRGYLDEAAFAAAGICIAYDDYRHPAYPQVQGGFASHMAAIDLIANVENSRAAMARGTD